MLPHKLIIENISKKVPRIFDTTNVPQICDEC